MKSTVCLHLRITFCGIGAIQQRLESLSTNNNKSITTKKEIKQLHYKEFQDSNGV